MDITAEKVLVRIQDDASKSARVLFEISNFKMKSGEKLLLKGASGQGKTTFLHLLGGLFSPESGIIRIGDTCLDGLSEDARCKFRRRHVAIVFQKLNLIEHLTALENVELSLQSGKNLKKAEEALKAVGLAGRENDRTAVMSLGEQQRVAVARVISSEAEVVLADEPTSSLDAKNAIEVMQLLLRSCEKKTLIVVSHDDRIEKLFDRVKTFEELIK